MKKIKNFNHTFVIPTFKKSPYLLDCLKSIKKQRLKSNIIITTSKPFKGISKLCKRFNVKLYIYQKHNNISDDWNRALSVAKTKWVTITHQDDVYLPNYLLNIQKISKGKKNISIIFTDYAEIN